MKVDFSFDPLLLLPRQCGVDTNFMLIVGSRFAIHISSGGILLLIYNRKKDVVHDLNEPVLHARMFPSNGDHSQQNPGAKVEEVDRQGSESKLQAIRLDSCEMV